MNLRIIMNHYLVLLDYQIEPLDAGWFFKEEGDLAYSLLTNDIKEDPEAKNKLL